MSEEFSASRDLAAFLTSSDIRFDPGLGGLLNSYRRNTVQVRCLVHPERLRCYEEFLFCHRGYLMGYLMINDGFAVESGFPLGRRFQLL